MIDSPSGRMPEKAPRWDLTGIEGCGGGKVVSWLSLMFLGYKSIYIGGRSSSGGHRGPNKVGGSTLPPLGVPVVASWIFRLALQVSWVSSGPRKITAKVLFRLDCVWYFFFAKLKNKEKQKLALGSGLIS